MDTEESQERADKGWLVLTYPGNPVIRFDARFLDRILVDDHFMMLGAGGELMGLEMTSVSTAMAIAESLSRYTRSVPILDSELYEDARRRLLEAAYAGPAM